MDRIADLAALEALFEAPSHRSLVKVATRLTPQYRRWIGESRFCILTTVGAGGTDASPRGDDGPVVRVVDDRTLWMPDWRGNNRLDSLRNIVTDGRVSLMFMVAGSNTVVRINGTAVLTADPAVTATFEQGGRHPKVVIAVTPAEVYFQCAKALMRARLWEGAAAPDDLPTAGQFLREAEAGFDAESYDAGYPDYARERMW